ncbi:MAG TPA: hypothetical protein VHD55_02850 [Candidatus Paceibacterota bacterium]|nr:hypothetical protein [Candidatus Paceibacterota bacterium]
MLPFASVQAADYSDYDYVGTSYYGSDSSSDYVGTSYYDSGSSNSGSDYVGTSYYTPDTSNDYDYVGTSYYEDNSSDYDYVGTSYYGSGCTTNCGGGGGGGGGGGCRSNCTPPPPKPAPVCDLSVSPSRVDYGDSVTISWTTSNAISAFLAGFGTVSTNGSRTSGAIYGTKTYTLTATASGGRTVTCSKTVTVEREHEHTPDLECKLKASDTSIERGDSVRITWSSDGADYGYITPDIGDVDESGSDTVEPRSDTTYKGTFYNDDGDKVTCSVKVNVDREYNPPVYENPTPYINLSAVPYTGLDLGPVGTVLYWAFLIAWCLVAAYLIAVKRVHMSVYRWYKKALFGEEVHFAPAQEVSFAGFSHADVAKLAEMLRGAVAPSHASAPVAAAPAGDAIDPFILSQIHRTPRS